MREADDAVVCEVHPDHPLLEALLERLLDHPPGHGEVALAAGDELVERHALRLRVAHGVLHHELAAACRFDLPHAVAAHAAVLLEHDRPGGEAIRQLFAKVVGAAIDVRVGAPAHVPRVGQHLLRPHLQDDIRMSADPHAVVGRLAQQRIEL
ncbi:MAG TPA: hypothetical protein VFW41_00435 [Gaiellaceae bacterium]|nr:hypothetical protein [Gaiellaceae bacterium]